MGDYEDDYGDDFYFDDDYLYVEDSYAIAVSIETRHHTDRMANPQPRMNSPRTRFPSLP